MAPSVAAASRHSESNDTIPFHHVVDEERVVRPLFAAESAPFHPGVNRYWRVLEGAATGDPSVSPQGVASAAETLLGFLRRPAGVEASDGLARFRREFCLGQLESLVALKGNPVAGEYMRFLLTGDVSGSTTAVDSSIRAGVADFNDRYVASLRRRYVAKDGLGERIIARIGEFESAVESDHPGVGIAASRHAEQASNAGRLLKQFKEVEASVRTFLDVIPRDRALLHECEQRLEAISSRLQSNHFGGVLYLSNVLRNDIREGMNLLKLQLDPKSAAALGGPGRPARRAS